MISRDFIAEKTENPRTLDIGDCLGRIRHTGEIGRILNVS